MPSRILGHGPGPVPASRTIDWEKEGAICPEGKTSLRWTPAIDGQDNKVMKIKFSGKDCMPCPSRDLCIRLVKDYKRRTNNQGQVQPTHEAIWPYMLDLM